MQHYLIYVCTLVCIIFGVRKFISVRSDITGLCVDCERKKLRTNFWYLMATIVITVGVSLISTRFDFGWGMAILISLVITATAFIINWCEESLGMQSVIEDMRD